MWASAPFVHQLAHAQALSGFVYNSSAGVTIEVEGSEPSIQNFLHALRTAPPPLAEITDICVSEIPVGDESGFKILSSREETGQFSLVPADAGTCDACWHDFGDPRNRRFGYPFTNCTHCGPRYTIIQGIPYDRASTTMRSFTMCADCQREYEDPTDRRFHAQPNACAVCGPSLALVPRGTALADCVFDASDSLAHLRRSRTLLRDGNILAVKGLGGYLLACDAQERCRRCRAASPQATSA